MRNGTLAGTGTVGFTAWGLAHVVALLAVAVLAGVAFSGLRRDGAGVLREAARLGSAATLAVVALAGVATSLEREWPRVAAAAPLHLCDVSLAAVVAALAAPRRWPWAFEFAYFFGVGGTLQALLTPDLDEGFPSVKFLIFFASHGGVVIGAALLVGAYGLRPRPWSVARMFAAGNAYAAAAAGYNLAFGTNFGYLCAKPAQASLLDRLGPWPWYLVAMEALVLAVIIALDLPFMAARRRAAAQDFALRPVAAGVAEP